MPRANRQFVHGYVWAQTLRCHHKAFLLNFVLGTGTALFEAKKRFGLTVLNYRSTPGGFSISGR